MEFRVLGPLEVILDGRVLPLGRGRRRALLGCLLLHANQVVARDRLLEALWGDAMPPTAPTALHGHVSRLRRMLGSDRLLSRPPGYLLRVAPGELDEERFRCLVARGQHAPALGLWRGAPLADFTDEPFAAAAIARLEELRLAALEGWFDDQLADGRHAVLVADLAAAVRESPLRERLAAQLMLALYRSGRQADALATYRATRTRLSEELGLEPGAGLRALEHRILMQDPGLDVAAGVVAA
jgi:DNA-binding SARP family transcriptional activator